MQKKLNSRSYGLRLGLVCLAALFWAAWGPRSATAHDGSQPLQAPADHGPEKQVIGATAVVYESSSRIGFPARIDTGAKTCSLHIEELVIENESKKMRDNLDKKARIRIVNNQGKPVWIDTKIAETVHVKTSEEGERRYKVWLMLRYGGVQKKVHVTLNDRSHMAYPLLVGRNFLRGDFLVDVEQEPKLAKSRKSRR